MFRLTALIALVGVCPIASAQTLLMQTVAGSGVPANQPALTANLTGLSGLAIDSEGNTYLALRNYGLVERLDTSGGLTRIAGTGVSGFSGDGSAAVNAQLSASGSLALDGSGNLYIVDSGNNRIRMVNASTGQIGTVAGGGAQADADAIPATNVSLSQLGGLAADSGGNLYFSSGCRIRKLTTATGLLSTVAGTGTCGFSGDQGPAASAQIGSADALVLDVAGNVYLVDNNRIRAIAARSGIIGTLAGTGVVGYSGDKGPASGATLGMPLSVAVDASLNVFLSDTANNRIRRIDGQTGTITTVVGTGTAGFSGDGGLATAAQLSLPGSLAVDTSGNLVIADSGNGVVRAVSAASGIITTIAGGGVASFSGDGGPAASAQFAALRGIAIDSSRQIYLADTGNCRVRAIDSTTGIVTTVAGDGAVGPSCTPFGGDGGPATSASLYGPSDVAVDGAGNLYIADTVNARIRKVNVATKTISTLAGGGTISAGSDEGPATAAKLVSPRSVAVDGSGNLIFSDYGDNRVRKVDAGGTITTLAGTGVPGASGDGGPATSAKLNGPTGLAIDGSGAIFISDSGNNRVRRIDPGSGTIVAVAGNGGNGFGGDDGPATNASLSSPQGIAVDPDGNLWIADEMNNRIRLVNLASGTITTIAGNGTEGSTGNGQLSTAAQVDHPWGISVAQDKSVYFTENGSSTLRVMAPLNVLFGCAFVVTPSSLIANGAGDSLVVHLSATNLVCAWSLSGLPSWISAFPVTGVGSGEVTLRFAENPGDTRSGTFSLAGTQMQVVQTRSASSCTYALSPSTFTFTPAGGTGVAKLSTDVGCPWTIAQPPSWVSFQTMSAGTGATSIEFTVAANTAMSRSAAVLIAGQTLTIAQNGASASVAGSFVHFAEGAGWDTRFTLINTGAGAANARMTFYDSNGNVLAPPPQASPQGSTPRDVGATPVPALSPAALLDVVAPGSEVPGGQQGSAQILTDGQVKGFGMYRLMVEGGYREAAVAEDNRISNTFTLPFDQTGGHYYGIALTNNSLIDAFVSITGTDAATGAVLVSDSLSLAAQSHTSFVLSDRFAALSSKTGTLKFTTFLAGQFSVVALRFNANLSFTVAPIFTPGSANAFSGFSDAGAFPQLAAGGGWSTRILLLNTGTVPSKAHLDFYDDGGAPMSVAVSHPYVPAATSAIASSVDETLAPGATVWLEADAPDSSSVKSGWAHLLAAGNVTGLAALLATSDAGTQESDVPVFNLSANTYLLVYDNSTGNTNAAALTNNSSEPAVISVVARDSLGNSIASEKISLPAWGHAAFGIAGRYPATANLKGSVEFSSPAGGQIALLGLRVNSNGAFTQIPALPR